MEAGPPSTGSSSNAGGNGGGPRQLVVINYADHVKQQLAGGISDHLDDLVSEDRSQSNISIGYNHAPTSPLRHFSSNNLEPGQGQVPEWPASSRAVGNTEAMFEDELEATDEANAMAFEKKN